MKSPNSDLLTHCKMKACKRSSFASGNVSSVLAEHSRIGQGPPAPSLVLQAISTKAKEPKALIFANPAQLELSVPPKELSQGPSVKIVQLEKTFWMDLRNSPLVPGPSGQVIFKCPLTINADPRTITGKRFQENCFGCTFPQANLKCRKCEAG